MSLKKNFDQLKNGMDYRRMRTHYTQTTDGKLFVAFIGLILRSVLIQGIKGNEATRGLTMKKVVRELDKIQQIRLKDGSYHNLPLTRLPKKILKRLDMDETLFH